MITSERGKVTCKGQLNEIMADYSVIKTTLEEMFEDNGLVPEEAFENIEISRQFGRLKKAGMDTEAALEVMFPNKSKDELKIFNQRFKDAHKIAKEFEDANK